MVPGLDQNLDYKLEPWMELETQLVLNLEPLRVIYSVQQSGGWTDDALGVSLGMLEEGIVGLELESFVGVDVGVPENIKLGRALLGLSDGMFVAFNDGVIDGRTVLGIIDCSAVGMPVRGGAGPPVGARVGTIEGKDVGCLLGCIVGN
ncbi:unnamed protein product [Cylindrotheca closterium]|uniref:Uncharacterized protein n=1 Tax=Cylindrotheca closterium TaxID=2856 RepID=A0AAD2GAK0_9STRA|nr:unnamed protein product [Cylindrotheca closterium]